MKSATCLPLHTVGPWLAAGLTAAIGSPVAHAQWTVADLHPAAAGATSSDGYGAAPNQQVGYATIGSTVHGGMWTGSAASWVDLNPAGATSSHVLATSGNAQVGYAAIAGRIHAIVWTGTAGSFVDYNPTNPPILSSVIYAIWGTRKAGRIQVGNVDHACVWGGSANSFTDLNPPDAASSYAFGVGDTQVVGYINTPAPNATTRPSMWTGDALSWQDLTPAGATSGMCYATADGQQVGFAGIGGNQHASKWQGTAGSWVDLHPNVANSLRSFCYGVSHGVQVGELLLTDGNRHAALWEGTPGSWVDLHALTNGMGFIGSTARSVWKDANFTYVAGWGTVGSFNRALLWRRPNPIPTCPADVAGLGGTAGHDGSISVDDLIFYLNAFFASNLAVADIAGLGGSTVPDGQLTPDDLIAFLGSFFGGC